MPENAGLRARRKKKEDECPVRPVLTIHTKGKKGINRDLHPPRRCFCGLHSQIRQPSALWDEWVGELRPSCCLAEDWDVPKREVQKKVKLLSVPKREWWQCDRLISHTMVRANSPHTGCAFCSAIKTVRFMLDGNWSVSVRGYDRKLGKGERRAQKAGGS